MKSQDILLLLKLISLHSRDKYKISNSAVIKWESDKSKVMYKGVNVIESLKLPNPDHFESAFTVRALAAETGISKSQVSLSINRCINIGLAKLDRKLMLPKTNAKALVEFIAFGIRYVFPAKRGEITRGIATSIAAPVLQGKVMTSGDLPPVWPDALSRTKGVAVEPLHKNISQAIRNDTALYGMLALTDAIRMGNSRERNFAQDKLNTLVKELQ